MRLLVWGIEFVEAEDGPPEATAREECVLRWGTDNDCLVVDACGQVLLNTTGLELEHVGAI